MAAPGRVSCLSRTLSELTKRSVWLRQQRWSATLSTRPLPIWARLICKRLPKEWQRNSVPKSLSFTATHSRKALLWFIQTDEQPTRPLPPSSLKCNGAARKMGREGEDKEAGDES